MTKERQTKTNFNLSKPQGDIYLSDLSRNLFLAGQGSGKSHIAGYISYKYIQAFPEVDGFIGANTYLQLSQSTLVRIFKVWRSFGITKYDPQSGQGHYVVDKKPPPHFKQDHHDLRSYSGTIAFITGQIVYIGSLENYMAHDGKEFGWACLDETKDTKEEAVKEVILGRLRQRGITNSKGEEFNPLYIFTSPAKVLWLNEMFKLDDFELEIKKAIYNPPDYFKKQVDKNKLATISSAYLNKDNLPENHIEDKELDMNSDLVGMLTYGDPFTRSGGEFYNQFDRSAHVLRGDDEIEYNPEEPLHITFDFNVQPYMTLCIWQVYGKTLIQIDELCLPSPKNRTSAICAEFKRKYSDHEQGVFVYGDPAGKAQDTRTEVDIDDFKIIMSSLSNFRAVKRLLTVAPGVSMRGQFINTIFEKNYAGIYIFINGRCKNTVTDYTFLKEDHEGKKLKEKVKDEITKITYEKFGHCSDANDYFICRLFMSDLIRFTKGIKGT